MEEIIELFKIAWDKSSSVFQVLNDYKVFYFGLGLLIFLIISAIRRQEMSIVFILCYVSAGFIIWIMYPDNPFANVEIFSAFWNMTIGAIISALDSLNSFGIFEKIITLILIIIVDAAISGSLIRSSGKTKRKFDDILYSGILIIILFPICFIGIIELSETTNSIIPFIGLNGSILFFSTLFCFILNKMVGVK